MSRLTPHLTTWVAGDGASEPERTKMGFAKIKGQLVSRVGQRVRYGAPKDVEGRGGEPALGTIEDEVWQDEGVNCSAPRPLGSNQD